MAQAAIFFSGPLSLKVSEPGLDSSGDRDAKFMPVCSGGLVVTSVWQRCNQLIETAEFLIRVSPTSQESYPVCIVGVRRGNPD